MAIDANIYSNIQAPQVSVPSIAGAAESAMKLSALGMQHAQMGYQMQQQAAIRGAYANNTDPQTGQLNRAGFLSDLGKTAPMVKGQFESQFAQQDKEQAEAKAAQVDAAQKAVGVVWPGLQYVAGAKNDQKPQVYASMLENLKRQGVDTTHFPSEYDPGTFSTMYDMAKRSKPALDNFLQQAQIGKTLSETGNVEKTRTTEYQKMLQGDEAYKKATNMLAEGKNALATVDDATKNPGSAANVPIMLARFTSAGSRMNENEIEANIKAGSFGDKLKQMYEKSRSGTLTPELADYARQYLTNQMSTIAQNKLDRENEYAGQYAVNTGLPKNVAYSRLTAKAPGTVTPTPEGPARFAKGQNSSGSQQSNYRPAGSSVSADEVSKYAMKHKMKLSDAQNFLRSQGYAIGN